MTKLKEVPDATKWKANTENLRFFGEPVKDMDREELLLLVGFLEGEERIGLNRPFPPSTPLATRPNHSTTLGDWYVEHAESLPISALLAALADFAHFARCSHNGAAGPRSCSGCKLLEKHAALIGIAETMRGIEHRESLKAIPQCDLAELETTGDRPMKNIAQMLIALNEIELCPDPNCGDTGATRGVNSKHDHAQAIQCEFCYINPRSKYNFKRDLIEWSELIDEFHVGANFSNKM